MFFWAGDHFLNQMLTAGKYSFLVLQESLNELQYSWAKEFPIRQARQTERCTSHLQVGKAKQ